MDIVKVVRNEQFYLVAEEMLSCAQRSVDICTYKFEISKRSAARDLNNLIQILYDLVEERVRVRVLLNIAGGRSNLVKINEVAGRALKAHGIEVRGLPDNRCQHAKILLVDRCVGIIGSHNWSPKSMTENFEVSVAINHAGCLEDVQAHFEKIWAGAKKL